MASNEEINSSVGDEATGQSLNIEEASASQKVCSLFTRWQRHVQSLQINVRTTFREPCPSITW